MMGQGIRIAIIGESVLMEGIVVSLAENPHFFIECTGENVADALNLVNTFKPHVIVFELEFPMMQTILSHRCDLVGVRLLALDDSCDRVLVMDCKLLESPSLTDLQEIITGPLQTGIPNHI